MSRRVRHDGQGALQIRFSFDRRLVDLVKTFSGRRWNPTEKYWTVPEDQVVTLVDTLHPEGFDFDETTLRVYRASGGSLSISAAGPEVPSAHPNLFSFTDPGTEEMEESVAPGTGADDYTVGRLNGEVRAVLEKAFPAPVWLVGEISGFNKNAHRRHVTFHLVEREEGGKALAEISATLFEGVRREIKRKLSAAGDPFVLEDEIAVRLRVRVELYVPWGSYRVIVEDIDVHYTLGEAARRREEIIRRLTEQGIVDLNTSLEFPAIPLRVGLITSLNSDAYNDVVRTLQESGYAFRLVAHGARVQGRQTEPSVLNALDWFRAHKDDFDVVLICRGGGSRTDLAWFDSEPLGQAVATFPLPVVVGIGHEQDFSVLDAVGWRCKTPTAAAASLVDRVAEFLEKIDEHCRSVLDRVVRRLLDESRAAAERARRLALAARNLLDRQRTDLDHRRDRVVRGARALLDVQKRELSRRSLAVPRTALVRVGQERGNLERGVRQLAQGARRDLATATRRVGDLAAAYGPRSLRRLALESERNERRARRLDLVHPGRVLERGYSILRREDGRVLTEASAAPAGAALKAELKRGALRLRSEGPEETPQQ